MALCTGNTCSITQQNDTAVLREGHMEIGDIYMVCAAVKHPLLDRLRNSSRYTIGTCLSTLMEDSLRLCSKKAASQAGRPCLICDTPAVSASADDDLPRICLMRIFQPRELQTMPAMLRHYLVPVYIPNSMHHQHIHTSPEWVGKSQQWVVAAPFIPPSGSLGKRLKSPSSQWPDGSNHYIGASAMQEFMRLCQDKEETWEAQSRSAYLRDLEEVRNWKPTRKIPQKFIPAEDGEDPIDDVAKQLQAFSMKSEVASLSSDAASTKSKASVKMLGLMRLRKGMSRTRLSQVVFPLE